jgi:hypothetical protein
MWLSIGGCNESHCFAAADMMSQDSDSSAASAGERL